MFARLNKLNGWRRIWLGTAVMSFFYFCYLLPNLLPTNATIDNEEVTDMIYSVVLFLPQNHGYSYDDIRAEHLGMSDAEMIHEFHKEYVNNNVNPFLQIDKFWDNRRKNLYKIQLQVIGIYLGCWIFFISSIYIIGLFIAWIVAGFRLRKDLI